MIRTFTLDSVGPLVAEAVRELFTNCKDNMLDDGDLLVCRQNEFIYDEKPTIGIGDGINWLQQLNSIICAGIGLTTDDEYFNKVKNLIFDGTTEVEKTTDDELRRYLKIWENMFFLRCLTQLAHLLNGEHYDWTLDIGSETKDGTRKFNYINGLIEKFRKSPKFYSLIKETYSNKIRNSIAHTQYVFVQDGFLFNNIKGTDESQSGLLFEQWERKFVISYLILIYIHQYLNAMRDQYLELYRSHNLPGISILVPCNNSWESRLVFPDRSGEIWRFVQ